MGGPPGGSERAAPSPLAAHRASPAELQEQIAAAREGLPFLVYRDGADRQRLVPLDGAERLTIGRRSSNDIALDWDDQVSRVHALIERVGEEWTVADDGLSRNGTFVNAVRIRGRRSLHDRDEVRCGSSVIAFCMPGRGQSSTTVVPGEVQALPRLTETQFRVLVALARPYRDSGRFATPASNKQIAGELQMSVEGVKSTLRVLWQRFAIEQLPQHEKRLRLVERAFQLGAIAEEDL